MPDPATDGDEEDSEIESNEEYAEKVSAANSDCLSISKIYAPLCNANFYYCFPSLQCYI